MITETEKTLAAECLEYARKAGAQDCRITLTKSTEDLIATLDGEVDRVTRCADRSMNIALFVEGRYGAFSINKLERDTLRDFISRAVDTVRMLAPDEYRVLPAPERCCHTALTGRELDSYDEAYQEVSPEDRRRRALEAAVFGSGAPLPRNLELISEEGEYSDSEYDAYVIDSQGLECRHRETSFDYGVEVTVQDPKGNKYSDYWWTASSFLRGFDPSDCGMTAVRRAHAQFGARPARSGKYNMVIGAEVASRLVSPLLNALNAYSLQQGNSFLVGSVGKKLFSDKFTLLDEPHIKGESGSKLFDSEGVATEPSAIIAGGEVKRYFVNTYMAGKTGLQPTVEDAVRPYLPGTPGLDRNGLMQMCGNGILVTDFNGGNCNPATGDFSYGISGQLFQNGEIVRPVNEMLITGNFLPLWKNLIGAGSDVRRCAGKLIPSLAFCEVDFSG